MLNLNHLYYFYLVAQTGSITSASRSLRISQPALSKQIKIFEESINKKLIERQGRGLRLTSAGLSLYGEARGVFDKAEQISLNLLNNRGSGGVRLKLGFGLEVDRSFMAEIIVKALKYGSSDEPRLIISSFSVERSALESSLRQRAIDACFTERRLFNSAFIEIASLSSPIYLAIPAAFYSKAKGAARKGGLNAIVSRIGLPWILPTPNIDFRSRIEGISEKHGIEMDFILESDSMLTVLRSVASGLGITLIPGFYASFLPEKKMISLLNCVKEPLGATMSLWARKAEARGVAIRRLTQSFKSFSI